MAQLVQGCGLQRQGRPTRVQQHVDARFGPPLLLPLSGHQAQYGTAVAGALAPIGQPLQRGTAAPQAHLGLLGVAHPADSEQARPLLQGGLDGGGPGRLALGFGAAGLSARRLDPDAPMVHDRPADRRWPQQMAVVAAVSGRGCSLWGLRFGWQHQWANLVRAAARQIIGAGHRPLSLGLLLDRAAHGQHDRQQGRQATDEVDRGHVRTATAVPGFSRPAGRRHGPSGLPAGEWRQSRPVRC